MKITIIAGAPPNFMKITPIILAIENKKTEVVSVSFRLIHTGQHYGRNSNDTFFKELEISLKDGKEPSRIAASILNIYGA